MSITPKERDAALALNLVLPDGTDWISAGDDAITQNAGKLAVKIQQINLEVPQKLSADIVGTYRHLVLAAWQRNTEDYYDDTYTDNYGGPLAMIDYSATVPLLIDGKIHPSVVPDLVQYARNDGSTVFDQIRIGQSVLLKEVRGARGHRLVFTSNNPGNENCRPYMEVNASSEDYRGDVIAGYQVHVTGNGGTPNSGERVYWFMEGHGLSHTVNANPDFEGWYSMGVSNRAELTERGRGRAFILDAGNRPGMAMHFYKPYIELQKNTAFTLDDRARPAFGDGVGANHQAQGVGTLIGGHYINFRREGALGFRAHTLNNTAATSPEHLMLRSRGTVTAPLPVLAGDRLSSIKSGTVYDVDPEHVHVPGGGTSALNRPYITAQTIVVATEDYVKDVAQGSRVDTQITPRGSTSLVTGLSVDEAPADGDTSILVRTNKDGTTTQTRVKIGAPDSGGPGLRALVIPN